MQKNILIFFGILVITTLILLAIGCGGNNKKNDILNNTTNKNSDLSVNMSLRKALELGYSVTRVNAKITKNSFLDSTDLNISGNSASGTFKGLEPGIYTINVNMYQNDTLIATGSGTGNVVGGQTITVNITMNFTGDLTIITTWGDTAGLIAYYPFNGNANDESGKGNNGTVYGATLTIDRFGNSNSAYSFNGLNSYIDLGNGIQPDKFTITAWIKPKIDKEVRVIISKLYNQSGYYGQNFELRLQEYGILFAHIPTGSVWRSLSSTDTVETDKWSFVVLTFDGETANLFINSKKESTYSGHYGQSNTNTTIGCRPVCDNGIKEGMFFNGDIDDLRIYNHALNESEIQALYGLTK